MFQQLLQIRAFREQRAQALVLAERAALRRATAARDAASETLDAFKAWAQAQEDALFSQLMSRAVQVREIQEVRHTVGGWRVKEQGYAQDLERSEADRVKQLQVLDGARARHAVIEQSRLKIAERVAMDHMQATLDRDRAEEREIEEVPLMNGAGASEDAQEGGDHE